MPPAVPTMTTTLTATMMTTMTTMTVMVVKLMLMLIAVVLVIIVVVVMGASVVLRRLVIRSFFAAQPTSPRRGLLYTQNAPMLPSLLLNHRRAVGVEVYRTMAR